MCACWEIEPARRPHFNEVSETLMTFLNEHDEYHREQTKEIEDEYYSIPCNDSPHYMNQLDIDTPPPE